MSVSTAGRMRLHYRSLFQLDQPAFWVFMGFLVYGAFRMSVVLAQLSHISRSGWALSWLLLALYALPVFVLIYRLDLYEREPLSLVLGAFAWGALAATALALDAAGWNQVLARAIGAEAAGRWGPATVAPIVEETLKGAGVVLIYLIARDEVDDAMDGFVYGALCGLGFAVVEDVLYFMAAFGGTPGGVLEGFYVRVLSSGLYGHVLYTGLTGLGIGYFVSRREHQPFGRRIGVAIGCFVAAVLAHALWNSPILEFRPSEPIHGAEWLLVPVALAVKGLPLLVLVLVAVKLARGRERRWLDGALEHEVGRGGVSSQEFATLREPARRRAATRAMRARAGRPAATLLQRLQREQVNLAMLVTRTASSEDPAVVAQRDYCRSLRDALVAIPGAASAAEDGSGRPGGAADVGATGDGPAPMSPPDPG
jgi:RsiW-degrading membrane proteinase PrsW (M82 family)